MESKDNHNSGKEITLAQCGERLKAIRKAKGFTNYEQFAYLHNIGRSQYGKYEKGADMRLSTLLRVLKALDITPEEFFSEGFDATELTEEKKEG